MFQIILKCDRHFCRITRFVPVSLDILPVLVIQRVCIFTLTETTLIYSPPLLPVGGVGGEDEDFLFLSHSLSLAYRGRSLLNLKILLAGEL